MLAQSEEAGNRYESVLVPYAVIEKPPAFPGCEGLEPGEAVKKCTSEKISGFVNKNFDTGIAKQLGLSGVNRVIVQFKIDENGEITDIRVRAPHPKLEEEARRVTDALPNMLPGKQRGKTVGTMYSLPIVFKVN
ncbi:energy transducer TonB [Salegentibacter chungangensis]|uniref:Energy transducer TonB n=1 Tax=Salegentibacter chungangensis TaxID=1335724 RepID=A0ABW3NST0_9FLAO